VLITSLPRHSTRIRHVMGQIRAHQAVEEQLKKQQQLSDVELGIAELAKAAKNPKMLADAMEALKDPEVAREVR